MNKPFKPGEELISLNEELHTEFSIQELEQRLETDPLMVAALLADGCTLEDVCKSSEASFTYCENNYCTSSHALIVCEMKYKDGDFCTPVCSKLL